MGVRIMARRKKLDKNEMIEDEGITSKSDSIDYNEKGGVGRGGVYDVNTGTVKAESDQEEVFEDLAEDEDII
jgi:hypothetical protein